MKKAYIYELTDDRVCKFHFNGDVITADLMELNEQEYFISAPGCEAIDNKLCTIVSENHIRSLNIKMDDINDPPVINAKL